MKIIKYLLEATILVFLLVIFRIVGIKAARFISSKIMCKIGPYFRSRRTIEKNLELVFKNINNQEKNLIIKNMWSTYGKILAEYVFMRKFRESNSAQSITVTGQKTLNEIKKSGKPVIFISGHFDNFELMALHIEKSGIDLTAIYRPLNNIFLNPLMEIIRKKFICKKQIKKGLTGTRLILKNFKKNSSIALMIDQRVSQGIKVSFFSKTALTTSIPAQFVKKFKCQIVPIYIERKTDDNFNLKIFDPIIFSNSETIESITLSLNKILENMILNNPNQWIWTHNRWK